MLLRDNVCVVDVSGRIVREAKVASEPEALIAWFEGLEIGPSRIGLEAGPLSQWLYAGIRKAGFAIELLETRHVRDAFKAMPVKTDRKDARGIAQLMRLGWFRPVHCKSVPALEMRALLTARKLIQGKRVFLMIEQERACCAFLSFALKQEPDAITVTIIAPEAVRDSADMLFAPFLTKQSSPDV